MTKFLVNIPEEQLSALRGMSAYTGKSMAEHIRRAIDLALLFHSSTLSGAIVYGVKAETSSGCIQISRSY